MMRECPDCFESWAAKEAKVASHRLAWGTKAWRVRKAESGDPRAPRIVHAIVSFVEDDRTVEEYTRDAYRIAKKHGLVGGVKVFHPFRKDKFDGRFTTDGTVHFHLIAIAPLDIAPGDGDEAVFKVLDDEEYRDYRGFRSARAIKRAIQYILTHCGIREGEHALTWWGAASYRSMSKDSLESVFPRILEDRMESRPCPVCGSSETEPCDVHDGFHVMPIHEYPDHEPDEDPDQAAWQFLRERLSSKPTREGELLHGTTPELEAHLRVVLAWNVRSRRVLRTTGRSEDEYALAPVFTLDCALIELRGVAREEVVRDGDLRLERILESCPSDLEDDMRFVFGSPLERLRSQRIGNRL